MEWGDLAIPASFVNNDFANNYRSYIFDMPEDSRYAGYTFAHPRKLTRYERGYRVLRLHDEWTFHLMKQAESGKLDEKAPIIDLSFDEMLNEFMDDLYSDEG